jgi:hypothetical protein
LDFASGQVIVPKTLDVNVYVPPKLEAGHDRMGEEWGIYLWDLYPIHNISFKTIQYRLQRFETN